VAPPSAVRRAPCAQVLKFNPCFPPSPVAVSPRSGLSLAFYPSHAFHAFQVPISTSPATGNREVSEKCLPAACQTGRERSQRVNWFPSPQLPYLLRLSSTSWDSCIDTTPDWSRDYLRPHDGRTVLPVSCSMGKRIGPTEHMEIHTQYEGKHMKWQLKLQATSIKL
jgi:hypothetical protein